MIKLLNKKLFMHRQHTINILLKNTLKTSRKAIIVQDISSSSSSSGEPAATVKAVNVVDDQKDDYPNQSIENINKPVVNNKTHKKLTKDDNNEQDSDPIVGEQQKQQQQQINKPKKKSSKQMEMENHFNLKPNLRKIFEQFPEKFLNKKTSRSANIYVADPRAAKTISKHLLEHINNNTGNNNDNIPLIEINPGPGVLTTELLKSKLKNLLFIENLDEFKENLQNILIRHNKGMDVTKLQISDFIGMNRLAYIDNIDNGNRLDDLFKNIPRGEWTDNINARIFLCSGSVIFIKELLNSIAFQRGLMAFGRPEIYMVLPPPLYIHLTCTNEASYNFYRTSTILFQIFFHHQFITKLPRKYFLPWRTEYDTKKGPALRKIYSIDEEFYYLIKMVPRRNLFDLCSIENLPGLWYFIRQYCLKRKNPIILTLEKLIPGCGPRLILTPTSNVKKLIVPIYDNELAKELQPEYSTISTTMSNVNYYENMDIFTKFGELSPSQLLTVFNQFQSWPEYKESPFLASLDNHLMKGATSSLETISPSVSATVAPGVAAAVGDSNTSVIPSSLNLLDNSMEDTELLQLNKSNGRKSKHKLILDVDDGDEEDIDDDIDVDDDIEDIDDIDETHLINDHDINNDVVDPHQHPTTTTDILLNYDDDGHDIDVDVDEQKNSKIKKNK